MGKYRDPNVVFLNDLRFHAIKYLIERWKSANDIVYRLPLGGSLYSQSQEMNRLHMYFKNGYKLSIICGDMTLGSHDGLFEIGIREMPDGATFPFGDKDGILEKVTENEVFDRIKQLALLEGEVNGGSK